MMSFRIVALSTAAGTAMASLLPVVALAEPTGKPANICKETHRVPACARWGGTIRSSYGPD